MRVVLEGWGKDWEWLGWWLGGKGWEIGISVGNRGVTQKTSRPLCRYCINQRELLRPVAAVEITGRNGISEKIMEIA